MTKDFRLLVINPGSTSTKIAVFSDENMEFSETLRHSVEELSQYNSVADQYEFRLNIILNTLKEKNVDINSLSAIVGRGGLLKPIEGGTYKVNETMLEDLKKLKEESMLQT